MTGAAAPLAGALWLRSRRRRSSGLAQTTTGATTINPVTDPLGAIADALTAVAEAGTEATRLGLVEH